jgi:hypothetical protein
VTENRSHATQPIWWMLRWNFGSIGRRLRNRRCPVKVGFRDREPERFNMTSTP